MFVFAVSIILMATSVKIVACRINPTNTSSVKIRVEQVVFPPFDTWKHFVVYKCTVIGQGSRIAGSQLNLIAPRIEGFPKSAYRPLNYEELLEVGAEYVVIVSTALPDGWTALSAEFSDERIGLTAMLSVSR